MASSPLFLQDTPTLRIGELARLSGRSVHTIRWYEAQRLMPGAARDAGGRRVFSQAHVAWLGLLDRLRASGMSVRDMQAYARGVRQGKPALAECRELLAQHRLKVQQRAEELRTAATLMDHKIAMYDKWLVRAASGGKRLP
ncbi:MerR family transcriptional regulator [Polaromonas sp.]|uniref:MerR family transcriptional regulator n=1 Tax=Polaromonas sp. TaxID=1869339 RepID=UPI0025EE095A|nr:MerR family transcriptional regulator [Polaromonas sp.]